MTFAEELRKITAGDKDAAVSFEARITGHPEEKILQACLREAKFGRNCLSFGRNILLPLSLKKEGLHLRSMGPGFECYW